MSFILLGETVIPNTNSSQGKRQAQKKASLIAKTHFKPLILA
jgi:hypothetical protein